MNRPHRTEAEQQALLAYLREKYVYEPGGQIRHVGKDRPVKQVVRSVTQNQLPYLEIKFQMKGVTIHVYYHRVVWALCKGYWPEGQLDHLNGNPQDNRIENLRECSDRENKLNKLLEWQPNAVTGIPGVFPDRKQYRCKIRGKNFYFRNPHEAFWTGIMLGKRYRNE